MDALEVFSNSPVTQDMVHTLVSQALQVLDCESSKYIDKAGVKMPLVSLMTFITKLVRHSCVPAGTLMSTIVYMQRLKQVLPKSVKGLPCTRHRIFLACLIIAGKTFHDHAPKNKHWSKYTEGLFDTHDVNLMEKQLLMLLDYNVNISRQELTVAWKKFLDPIINDRGIRENISKGMLMGSTQTVAMNNAHVRQSSVVSTSTVDDDDNVTLSSRSRSSSVSSAHSDTSIETVSSEVDLKTGFDQLSKALASLSENTTMNNYLKSVAMQEQRELDNLLRQYF